MSNQILTHVGDRIKLYRKHCGMSMAEMGEKIHKSKATVAKYESGQIAIDIVTIFDIAAVLEIAPFQLFDCTPHQKTLHQSDRNPFTQADSLYLYHMRRKSVYISTLSLCHVPDTNQIGATLFYKVDHPEKPQKCDCIYHGHMYSCDTALSFIMRNYDNPVENILINFIIPMRKTSVLVGMNNGLGSDTFFPTSYKMILSKEILEINDELRVMLTIDPKLFKEFKRENMMFLPWNK